MASQSGSSAGGTGTSGDQPGQEPEQPASGSSAALQQVVRRLMAESSGGAGQPPRAGRPRRLTEVPYDPEPRREITRSRVAYALVTLLMLVALSIIGFLAANMLNLEEAKELAVAIFSPLIGVTGAVFGFYYGGHRRGE